MALQILLLIIGTGLLVKGSDWMVDGASALAKKYNISDLAIGLTIVAFGTSAPELVVNIFASFQEHQAIAFGNVIGSNNFNLFVILGISGLITPLVIQSGTVWKEIPLSFFAIIILFILSNDFCISADGTLSRIDGVILLLVFVSFLLYVFKQLKNKTAVQESGDKGEQIFFSTLKICIFIIAGLVCLTAGGKLIVTGAVRLASALGVSEKIIGITIVAGGTSLPELATSVTAAIKKNNDIAVGNIIGSNIFNIFFILGVSSVIRPLVYDPVFNTDLLFLAIGTIILFLAMFSGEKRKLDRWEAGVLLVIYMIYSYYLIIKEV